MSDIVAGTLGDPSFLIALLVAIAMFATVFTLLPSLGPDPMKERMKSVALERDAMMAKRRAQLSAEGQRGRLRENDAKGMRQIVEKLDLRKLLADESTLIKLRQAGLRGENPMTRFLFFRFALPIGVLILTAVLFFVVGMYPTASFQRKLIIMFVAAYFGFYLPVLYISNLTSKRQASLRRGWPDALDLLLICVESGMSVEAGLRRVAQEIHMQSVDLAEELALTTAELSYLPERRQAYENLSDRTGLDAIKNVMQALIQAERYGTPVATALRTLANESREMRMMEAEKKAAALPPKLTVPMILFFLPVLFAVIIGPAILQVMQL
ncbi:type II secretion system F family protein [Limoniibacter endophyticus]|uniref:type II secretion system F family protein n=1 Tax=Limoniibacter endophyticus TaxID=1565040 RepID=UPI001673D553|nr:type II secretion system F family protein [Limoniibacter endophyticus]